MRPNKRLPLLWLVLVALAVAGLLPTQSSNSNLIPSRDRTLVGIYYFAGWWREQPNKWTTGGQDWRTNWPERVPLLGEYNEPETMTREIAAAADHGVDFFQMLWYPAGGSRPQDWATNSLNAGLRLFLGATNRHRMKFTLEYVNHPPFDLPSDQAWQAACRVWVQAMQSPEYLRVDGRPVFKIHGLHHFLNQNGGDPGKAKARLDQLRALAREAGLNPLLGGGVMASGAGGLGAAAGAYDYLTTYMDMPPLPPSDQPYPYADLLALAERAWAEYAAHSPKPYVPYLPAGWDPRPWRDPRPSFAPPTREAWREALRKVWTALDTHPNLGLPAAGGRRQKALLIYAWNEFGEGGMVAPTRGEGAMKLEAIQAAKR